jgi:hypothetical protein
LENPIVASLVISALGMPLLFLALAFFYAMLSLMTSGIQDRLPMLASRDEPGDQSEEDEALQRAAAIAVAMARADAEGRTSLVHPPAAAAEAQTPSPWWLLHHQRQLGAGSNTGRIVSSQ